jgi:hypothetical protein
MIPGFAEWLDYRGRIVFPDWDTRLVFNTTEVFVTMLGKTNYHYTVAYLAPPLPEGFQKGRLLWSRQEATALWHWAYANGWFNPVEEGETR